MRQTIDGAMFRRMVISAAASIEIHKEKINELLEKFEKQFG